MRWNILRTVLSGRGQSRKHRYLGSMHSTLHCYKPQLETLEHRLAPAIILSGPNTVIVASSPLLGGFGTMFEDADGNLFGTSWNRGSFNHGMVFELAEGSDTIAALANFNGANGGGPNSLLEDPAGNLFGTASDVAIGYGTVFEVRKNSGTVTTIAGFNNTTNGAYPSGLVKDSAGNLFGVTAPGGGGFAPDGSVFEVKDGSSTIVNLAGFSGYNGYFPASNLILDSSGNLFGTTVQGGPTYFSDDGYGTVFELQKGSHTITTLASFESSNGAYPEGNIVMDSSGNLFGTTTQGGAFNDGTIFEVQKGSHAITTVANFTGGTVGGSNYSPSLSGVVQDGFGNLFGNTSGEFNNTGGALFELPKGSNTIDTLVSFESSYSVEDSTPLVVDNTGDLFGLGGSLATDQVSVFELKLVFPNGTINQPLYNQTITATGGSGSMTFGVTSGTLPAGLTLSIAGVLSGTPTAVGSYTFTVSATDSTGASGSQSYTVNINPPPSLTTATLASASRGAAYSQSFTATGGTGTITYSTTGTLPTSLSLSTTGVLAGTPTAAPGSYSFSVTATDTVGVSTSQTYTLTIGPGPLNQYLVNVAGPSTVPAGGGLLLSVQAADSYGDPITSYSGPATVTATLSPAASSNLPTSVSINANGLGFFLTTVQQAGSYTIIVSDISNTYTGVSPALTVTPASPAQLSFAAQPASTATGVPLAAVTVLVQDVYGNVITSDNMDVVTLSIASGPGSFTAGSTTTATVTGGIATFNALTLAVPGAYRLGALVVGRYTGLASNLFTVSPLQVAPGSFSSTPSGFSVQFNAPFLVNSTTPVLYGSGFGLGAGGTGQPPSVILTRDGGNLADTAAYVPGTVVLNAATNSLEFIETDTASAVNNGTPLLPDGVYTAVVRGTAAHNGLQALNSGGGFLDGAGSGTPGSDFTASFTVTSAAAHDDVVWLPATAAGPLQPLTAPGNNRQTLFAGGLPLYLVDATGGVTRVTGTLTYNPSLLTVTGGTSDGGLPGSSFTVTVTQPGSATFTYTDAGANSPKLTGGVGSANALIPGSAISAPALGFLTATVPNSLATTPIYKAKDVLTVGNVQINGTSTIPVIGASAVHLVAYAGDTDGNGAYSSNDAVLITRALVSTDSGFAAYPLVDPTIIADTDGSGFIPSDAALQANEAGVGFPTANLAIPPIPPGADSTPIGNNVDPSVSLVASDAWRSTGNVTVAVNIDDAHPAGSTGLIRGHVVLTYNPRLFTVSAADVHPGSLLDGGNDSTIVPIIDQTTGQIAIALSSDTPITSALGGSLITVDFHPTTGVGSSSGPTAFAIVASASPNGQYVDTELEDAQGTFTLTPAPNNGFFNPAIDATVTLPTAASGGVLPGVMIAPLLVLAAAPGDGHSLDDDDPSLSVTPSFHHAAVSVRDVSETPGTDVRQPVVVHGNDATHPLADEGSFVFSAAAALATSGSPLGGLALQAAGGSPLLLGLPASGGGQRMVNAYLLALAYGFINNPGDLAPIAGSLTESFSRAFAGDFPAAATTTTGDNDGLESSKWEELTGDLDWQQAIAAATSKDAVPTIATTRRKAVETHLRPQPTNPWDAYFAEMAAATDDYLAAEVD